MKKILILLAVLGSVTLAQAQTFDTNLDGFQEVPPNATPAYGATDFTLTSMTLRSTVARTRACWGAPLPSR